MEPVINYGKTYVPMSCKIYKDKKRRINFDEIVLTK